MLTKSILEAIDKRAAKAAGVDTGSSISRGVSKVAEFVAAKTSNSTVKKAAQFAAGKTTSSEFEARKKRQAENEARFDEMTDIEIAELPIGDLPVKDGVLRRRMNGIIQAAQQSQNAPVQPDLSEQAKQAAGEKKTWAPLPEQLSKRELDFLNRDSTTFESAAGLIKEVRVPDGNGGHVTHFVKVSDLEQWKKNRDERKGIIDANAVKNRTETDRTIENVASPTIENANLPDFYQQRHNGRTMEELLAMRDYKRDQIPTAFSVKEWREMIKREIDEWATEATKSEESSQEGEPSASEFASLSIEDRQLLTTPILQLINDADRFERHKTIQSGVHPDSGQPINLDRENELAKQTEAETNRAAISDASEAQTQGADLTPEGIAEASTMPDSTGTALDAAQLAADAVGVVDPTGIVDAANAAVSLGRAVSDPERRGEHLKNAAISAVSAVPFGDVAKVGKLGSAGKTVKNSARLADAGKAAKAADKGGVSLDAILAAGGKMDDIPLPKTVINEENGRTLFDSMQRRGFDIEEILGAYFRRESDAGANDREAAERARERFQRDRGDTSPGGNAGGGGDDGGGVDNATAAMPDPDDPGRSVEAIEDEIEGRKRSRISLDKFSDGIIGMLGRVGKYIGPVIGFLEGSRLLNKGVLLTNSYLGEFNPDVAQAFAEREAATVRRSIREGRELASVLRDAVEADTIADDTRSKITTPITGIFVDLESTATRLSWRLVEAANNLTGFSKGLNIAKDTLDGFTDGAVAAIEAGAKGLGIIDDKDTGPEGWQRFFDDVGDGTFDDTTQRDRVWEREHGGGGDDPKAGRKRKR